MAFFCHCNKYLITYIGFTSWTYSCRHYIFWQLYNKQKNRLPVCEGHHKQWYHICGANLSLTNLAHSYAMCSTLVFVWSTLADWPEWFSHICCQLVECRAIMVWCIWLWFHQLCQEGNIFSVDCTLVWYTKKLPPNLSLPSWLLKY